MFTKQPVYSRIGTRTQKDFRIMPMPESMGVLPTGVWGYRRVELRELFPQLGDISLATYYLLRISCCAHLLIAGEDTLQDCPRCRSNHGYVCPGCLGGGWVDFQGVQGNMLPCSRCMVDEIREHGKIVPVYDADKEQQSVRAWLVKRFIFSVPKVPTEADLILMDR